MGVEQQPPEEHEGEKFLRAIGLDHLAETPMVVGDTTMQARDFLDVCGEHARPALLGFETLAEDDPRYAPTLAALQQMVTNYVETHPVTG